MHKRQSSFIAVSALALAACGCGEIILPPPPPPLTLSALISLSTQSGNEPLSVNVGVSVGGTDKGPVRYLVSFNNGQTFEVDTISENSLYSTARTFNQGSHKIVAKVEREGLSATASSEVLVAPPPQLPVIVKFTATPVSIAFSITDSATIELEAQYSLYCNASGGWSGAKNPPLIEKFSPDTTSLYIIRCVNNNGFVEDTIKVTVSTPPSPEKRVTKNRMDSPVLSHHMAKVIYLLPRGATDCGLDTTGYLRVVIQNARFWLANKSIQKYGIGKTIEFDLFGGQFDILFFQSKYSHSEIMGPGESNAFGVIHNELKSYNLIRDSVKQMIFYQGINPAGHGGVAAWWGAIITGSGDECPQIIHPAKSTTLIHEYFHTIQFVDQNAPNHDNLNPGHTTDNCSDIMFGGNLAPNGICDGEWFDEIDPGGNDWYGPNVPIGVRNAMNDNPWLTSVTQADSLPGLMAKQVKTMSFQIQDTVLNWSKPIK